MFSQRSVPFRSVHKCGPCIWVKTATMCLLNNDDRKATGKIPQINQMCSVTPCKEELKVASFCLFPKAKLEHLFS